VTGKAEERKTPQKKTEKKETGTSFEDQKNASECAQNKRKKEENKKRSHAILVGKILGDVIATNHEPSTKRQTGAKRKTRKPGHTRKGGRIREGRPVARGGGGKARKDVLVHPRGTAALRRKEINGLVLGGKKR